MTSLLSYSFIILTSAVLFGACMGSSSNPASSTMDQPGAAAPADKQGDTTKTGSLTQINGAFYLQQPGGTPELIESLAVDLSLYVGKTVTVTGQYSGDTLFVGSITE